MDFSRNIGLVTPEQQKRLERASVLVCGAGGMGGVAAEVLARMGVGRLTLVDHDKFEASNVNRQIHCKKSTIGEYKTLVLKREFQEVNPELEIRTFEEPVGLANAQALLGGVDVVINGMDQMYASICLEREARRRRIPIVDAWLTPFASVFTMKPEDPHWEEFLDFPTRDKKEGDIGPDDCRQAMKKEVDYTLSHFEPYKYVSPDLVSDVVTDRVKRPSLAPVVWLSGVLMANEAFKMIVGLPTVGPRGVFYDQYEHRLMPGKAKI
jgi:molybdopterin/thiamine biosynthesis adenylyltransferase